jgi:hypothetical protein
MDCTRLDLSTTQDLFPWDVVMSGGTREVDHQLFERMDLGDIHRLLSFWGDYRWSIKPPFESCVPLGHLVTLGGEDLDFQVEFTDEEIDRVNLHIGWYLTRTGGSQPFFSEITLMGNYWTRYLWLHSFHCA